MKRDTQAESVPHLHDCAVERVAGTLRRPPLPRCATGEKRIQTAVVDVFVCFFIYPLGVFVVLGGATGAKRATIHSVSVSRKLLTLSASLF